MSILTDMESSYMRRMAEPRMLRLIDRYIPDRVGTIVDIGCGAGNYGEILADKANEVIGIDLSENLCQAARSTGRYSRVICDSLFNILDYLTSADAIYCSEVLEHIPPSDLSNAIRVIHALSPKAVIFTTPNPLSPHYRMDPTHVARYTVFSMLRKLNQDGCYHYRLKALGFSDRNLKRSIRCRILNPVCSRFPIFSPTVAYIALAGESDD